jgi:ABC-type oligopeptide transport system substrate-binding subunit
MECARWSAGSRSHLSVFTSNNPNNKTGFKDPKYDSLVEAVAKMKPGSPERLRKLKEAQSILISQAAVIFPVYHYRQYILIKKSWKNLTVTPMGIIDFRMANQEREL